MKTMMLYGGSSHEWSLKKFSIKNKRLFDFLTELDLKFRNVNYGKFSSGTKVELPSGDSKVINGNETFGFFAQIQIISQPGLYLLFFQK